jgi:hypothetical protein
MIIIASMFLKNQKYSIEIVIHSHVTIQSSTNQGSHEHKSTFSIMP